jgi:hypothetical protein
MACAAMAAVAPAFAGIDGVADDNPYSVISQRNIFRLGTPPPPAAPDADKSAELPKVMLTGFFESAHVMRVLLAKPPLKDATNSIAYLSLKVGERKDDVEVVRIRYEKGEVDILNSGVPETLSAASNTLAASSLALKANGEPRADLFKRGTRGFRPLPLPGAPPAPPAAAMQRAGSYAPTAAGSSGIVLGGGAGSTGASAPGAGIIPHFPEPGVANSGEGAGATPAAGAFVSGPGASSSPSSAHGTFPHSLSEAEMKAYLASQAAQNQGPAPAPPTPPDQ